MRLLIAGPQGSGKTTQAQIIAQHFKLCLVDAGNMIRQIAKEDTQIGRKVDRALKSGKLISNKVAAMVVQERLNQADCQNGYVLDGYPRTIAQLKVFDPLLDQAFYLKLSDDLAKERMHLRQRQDDTPKLIEARLHIFHRRTRPVLDYYRKLNKLTEIDGSLGVDQISQQIIEKVKAL